MSLDIVELMKGHPELVIFVLLALAYFIGNLQIGPLDLGTAPGMLISSLIFGALGFKIFPGLETIGLFLFLYAVAFQAGPAFFSVVLADGKNYVFLAVLATLIGFFLTYLFHLFFHFEPGVASGFLAGSLTSPAGVAAALDTAKASASQIAPNLTPEKLLENVSVSYALTFLIADISLLFLARSMPNLFGFDLKAEAKRAAVEKNVIEGEKGHHHNSLALTLRAYEVAKPNLVGKTIGELQEITDCSILVYKTGGLIDSFTTDTQLKAKDRVAIWGKITRQDLLDDLFGAEVVDFDLLGLKISSEDITINHPDAIRKTIQDLNIVSDYGCYPIHLTRSGIELSISPTTPLGRGDVLTPSSPQIQMNQLSKKLGFVERDVHTTDLVTFAAGVAAGFLIGQIKIAFGDLEIGLGTPGGLLFVGILLGYLRSIHPTFGRVPPATLWIFKQLGLLFFLAGVGTEAGRGILQSLSTFGIPILLASFVVATVPVILSFLYGLYVMKMNPALLLGAVLGAVTCTPAMAAVTTDAKSSIPTIGYAGTYAFATVFEAIACSLMTTLVR